MRPRRLSVPSLALAALAATTPAVAQPPAAESEPIAAALASPCDFIFPSAGLRPSLAPDTFQLLSGYLTSSGVGPNPQWPVDYVPVSARFGWYVTDPFASRAVSLQLDYTAAAITSNFGHFWTGPSLLLRGEWRPDRALVPYIQAGAGIVFNDAYRDQAQRAIGSVREFNLEADGGLRYRFGPNWSLDAEVTFQHISNADSARRNGGINDVGFRVGFTYTFDHR
jgi:opacity protein-like surface antigen